MFRRFSVAAVCVAIVLGAGVVGAQESAPSTGSGSSGSSGSSRRLVPRVQLPKTLGRVTDELRSAIPQPSRQQIEVPDAGQQPSRQTQSGQTQRRFTDRMRELARTKIHAAAGDGALNLADFGATQPFALSAESKYLVATMHGGAGLAVWETQHHRRLMRLENSERPYALVAVSAQGRWVAAVRKNNPDQIDLWEVGTGRHLRAIDAAGGAKRQLDFTSEDELHVTAANGDGLTISVPAGEVTGGSRSATGRAGVRRPSLTLDGRRAAPPAAAPSIAAPPETADTGPADKGPADTGAADSGPRTAAPRRSAPRKSAPRVIAAPRARSAPPAPEEPPMEEEVADDTPGAPYFVPGAAAPDDSEIAGQNAPPIEADEPAAAAPADSLPEESDTSTGAAPWARPYRATPPPPPSHSFGAAPAPVPWPMPAPGSTAADIAAPGSMAPGAAAPEAAAPDWGRSAIGGGAGEPAPEQDSKLSADEPSGGAAPEISSDADEVPALAAPSAPPEDEPSGDEMGEPAGAEPPDFAAEESAPADAAPEAADGAPESADAAPDAVIEESTEARGPFHFEMPAQPESPSGAGAGSEDDSAPPEPMDEPIVGPGVTAAPSDATLAMPPLPPSMAEPSMAAPTSGAPPTSPRLGAPSPALAPRAPSTVPGPATSASPAVQPAVETPPANSISVHYATNRNRLAPKDRQWSVYFMGFFTSLPAFILYGVVILSLLVLPWFGKRTWAATALIVGLAVLGSMATFEAYVRSQLRDEMTGELYGCRPTDLSYGTCTVSVPRPTSRRPGEVSRPVKVWVLEAPENPDKHFMLRHVEEHADGDAFYQQLAAELEKSEARAAMLFIHGYNVSFEDAVFRTAQLAVDLKFPGAAMSFCWPSYADPVKYTFDEQNAEVSIPALREVLNDLATKSGAKRIHLIAHSMGNRVLAGALEGMDTVAAARNQQVFRELVLAAPDIDSRVFRTQVLPHIVRNTQHCTLYASSRDRALLMSRFFHNYQRLGETEPELLVTAGVDTIDASLVDTSLLGHSYIGDVQSIVSDLRELVVSGKRPVERLGLQVLEHQALRYWLIKPAMQSATARPRVR